MSHTFHKHRLSRLLNLKQNEDLIVCLKPSIVAFDEPCMYANPNFEPITYKKAGT